MTSSPTSRATWRSPFGGIALVALLTLLAAACSDSAGEGTTIAPDAPTTTATAASTTTTESIDDPGDIALRSAIDAVGDSYAFTTDVSVAGTVITTVNGQVDDTNRFYQVDTAGATLEYVVAAEGRWVREPGGAWLRLDEAAPVRPPLAALASPTGIVIVAEGDNETVLEATYEAVDLGFTEGTVLVTMTIRNGLLTEITYEAPLGEGLASVVTTIDADAEVKIEVPAG